MISTLKELPRQQMKMAGGKAATLARLTQANYPVPDGFVILPDAFESGGLTSASWREVRAQLDRVRGHNGQSPFAVRSSALAEDSSQASFAGEFETILDISTDDEIYEAIHHVYESRTSERVQAYSAAQGLNSRHEMAVIVQKMVPAEFGGVLFTADPLTGSQTEMTGNFVRGLGEQLVSGEVNAETFVLSRASGRYEGPNELKRFARRLHKMAERLEKELGSPQDIEWAVAGGELYLLQSRPITTLQGYNPRTGEWNDSYRGDYFWTNANFGEALPDVMTPLTWSLIQIYAAETIPPILPGNHPSMGNIGGRFYFNISLFASMMKALGFSRERMNRESEEFFGNLPPDLEIPMIPFTRWDILRRLLPRLWRIRKNRSDNLKRLAGYSAAVPARCEEFRGVIRRAQTTADLSKLWQEELEPFLRETYRMLQAGTSEYENTVRPLRHKLSKQVAADDANILLSGVSRDGAQLASLGPVTGLHQVARGEKSREVYLQEFGHRGVHEFEIYFPQPAEEPQWLDERVADMADVDVPGLLARQDAEKSAAWKRYEEKYPGQAAKMQKKIDSAASAARGREAIRSETTRFMGVARAFALRAGELTELGDDAFFLSIDELLIVLEGDQSATSAIPLRRQAYDRQTELPQYPALINGRFDPYAWAADPQRRHDIFDAHLDMGADDSLDGDVITGFAGAAGVVEGKVRLIENVEDGHLLQTGEILLTATTNVGWTPLFPRAAGIITDVGAPLSHAAIVARELGIPAVVGCGSATMRLHSGDNVHLDGGNGIVRILTKLNDSIE